MTCIEINTLPVSSYALAMNGGYFDIRLSSPLSFVPKWGDRLQISIDNHPVFDGYVIDGNEWGFRLVEPLSYLGLSRPTP